jgi:hypothetical protein
MYTKTIKQRIALVAASALTAGFISVVSAPAAHAVAGDISVTTQTAGGTAAASLGGTTGTATIHSNGTITFGVLADAAAATFTNITGGTFTAITSGGTIAGNALSITSTSNTALVGLIATPTAAGTNMVVSSFQTSSSGTAYDVVTVTVIAAAGMTISANGLLGTIGQVVAPTTTVNAKTMTITSDGVIGLTTIIGGVDSVSKLTVSGGTIASVSAATDGAPSAARTSLVFGDEAIVVTIKPDAGSASMIIKSFSTANQITAGTNVDKITVTVVPAANIATFSGSKSYFAGLLVATSGLATNVDIAYSLQAANGTEAIIGFSLFDANGIAMPTSTVITASATNGAVVAFASASQLGASVTSTYQGTFGNIYVAQGTKYAAIDTVVSLSVNGVVYASKAIALQGDVKTITLSDNVVGALAASAGNAYYTTITDSLGHKIGGLTTSIDATQFNTSVTTAAAATTTASTGAATSALFTCGSVAGKTNFKVTYTNPTSLVKITSNALDLLCGGDPYTWTASLDKASYVAGDIATLTITAKDITGAVVNDVITMGASITVSGSQLTAVVTPVTGDTFTSGVKKYKFLVGSTSGSYNAVVDVPYWTGGAHSSSAAQAAQTVKYSVASDGSVSNAQVLQSIVALIASINKQIQALQKLILARR